MRKFIPTDPRHDFVLFVNEDQEVFTGESLYDENIVALPLLLWEDVEAALKEDLLREVFDA